MAIKSFFVGFRGAGRKRTRGRTLAPGRTVTLFRSGGLATPGDSLGSLHQLIVPVISGTLSSYAVARTRIASSQQKLHAELAWCLEKWSSSRDAVREQDPRARQGPPPQAVHQLHANS